MLHGAGIFKFTFNKLPSFVGKYFIRGASGYVTCWYTRFATIVRELRGELPFVDGITHDDSWELPMRAIVR
jgi:hypothetical protein